MKRHTEVIVRKVEDLNSDEKNRLLTHGLHEEGVFYNRLNFFLVFESVFIAAAVTGVSQADPPPLKIILPLCGVGVLISFLWWCAQVNKLILLTTLEERADEAFLEMKETGWIAEKRQGFLFSNINKILAHVLPGIFIIAWLYLLVYSWLR